MNSKEMIEAVLNGEDPRLLIGERQKSTPSLAFPGEEPKTRKGSFKVSKVALDLYKKEMGLNPEDTLFKSQKDLILKIPYNDLPKVFGKKDMADAQDFIAYKPKEAFKTWMSKVGNIEPKLHKAIRSSPELVPLWFYLFMVRVSGRDMADITFKKYFTTMKSNIPKKKVTKEEIMNSKEMIEAVLNGEDPIDVIDDVTGAK